MTSDALRRDSTVPETKHATFRLQFSLSNLFPSQPARLIFHSQTQHFPSLRVCTATRRANGYVCFQSLKFVFTPSCSGRRTWNLKADLFCWFPLIKSCSWWLSSQRGRAGGKTSEPHQRFLPTVCIVCKLRPVFCVLLQRSWCTLIRGIWPFKSAPYCVCFNNESQMLHWTNITFHNREQMWMKTWRGDEKRENHTQLIEGRGALFCFISSRHGRPCGSVRY